MRIARTISGNDITAVATAAPSVENVELDVELPLEPAAHRTARAQQQQQQITHHHRRQHQRQVHEGIEQRAAGKAPARQQPGHEDCRQQADAARCAEATARLRRSAESSVSPRVHMPARINFAPVIAPAQALAIIARMNRPNTISGRHDAGKRPSSPSSPTSCSTQAQLSRSHRARCPGSSRRISISAKMIAAQVRRARLEDVLGSVGAQNVQGETAAEARRHRQRNPAAQSRRPAGRGHRRVRRERRGRDPARRRTMAKPATA